MKRRKFFNSGKLKAEKDMLPTVLYYKQKEEPYHTKGRVTDDFLFNAGLGKGERDRWLSSFLISQLEGD